MTNLVPHSAAPRGRYSAALLLLCLSCFVFAAGLSADSYLKIGRPVSTSPSEQVNIPIIFENSDPGFEIGGFDLRIEFDTSLIIDSVRIGQLPAGCNWEFFTYRIDSPGLLHIVAMADINNGPSHPSCYCHASGALAVITATAIIEPSLEFDFQTLRFIWYDCGDNTLSSVTGDTLFISDDVYAFNGVHDYLITKDTAFPTVCGAPNQCLPNERAIDFYSGGVFIILNDTLPPTAFCPDTVFAPNDPDQCGAVVAYEATAADNSPGATISCDPPSASYFPVGTAMVTCIAVDIFDQADTCAFPVILHDTDPPVALYPNDTTIVALPGDCCGTVAYTAAVEDNCLDASISCTPPPTECFALGTTAVTCIAIDPGGNADTGIFTITVIDTQPPQVFCPSDTIIPADIDNCEAAFEFSVTANDNCPNVAIVCDPPSGSSFSPGVTTITCIATDAAENIDSGTFTVTVIDTQPPVAVCPDDITIANDSGYCGAVVNFAADVTDNCDGAIVTCIPPSGSLFPGQTSSVRCVAVDAAGNADTAFFTVTVIDSEPPVLATVSDISVANDPEACGAIVTYAPTISDNCPLASVSCTPPSGAFFEIGAHIITCIGTDYAGNADTGSFSVYVADTSAPVLLCPDDIVVLNDSGYYGAFVDYQPDASDNCGQVTLHVTPPSGSYFPKGLPTVVSVIATDGVGNAASCTFTVTVNLNDPDNDRRPSWDDNCPDVYNPDQADIDGDGIGDVCDWRYGDANGDDEINVADVVFLVAYIFSSGPPPEPLLAGDANCDGEPNVADAVFLIHYIFSGGPTPECP